MIERVGERNDAMRRATLSVLVIAALVALPAAAFAAKVAVPEGTPVKVMFDAGKKISSGELKAGDTLSIRLVEDVKIGGKSIVGAGAKGIARVKEVTPSSKPGKPGKIEISFIALSASGEFRSKDGSDIKLAGTAVDKGSSHKLLSWLFILGLFIKGGQGEIDTSQIHQATVGETIVLESR
jgi:hypothetical protein